LTLVPVALAGLLVAGGCGKKTDDTNRPRSTGSDADNTRMNTRDKDGASPTPSDQKNTDADVKRTADIRKRIVDAKLSSDATNVKVITQNGRVTLRGPVKSQAEKDSIKAIARDVAGESNVEDLLEVESGR